MEQNRIYVYTYEYVYTACNMFVYTTASIRIHDLDDVNDVN